VSQARLSLPAGGGPRFQSIQAGLSSAAPGSATNYDPGKSWGDLAVNVSGELTGWRSKRRRLFGITQEKLRQPLLSFGASMVQRRTASTRYSRPFARNDRRCFLQQARVRTLSPDLFLVRATA
jgi:hypothetical protein